MWGVKKREKAMVFTVQHNSAPCNKEPQWHNIQSALSNGYPCRLVARTWSAFGVGECLTLSYGLEVLFAGQWKVLVEGWSGWEPNKMPLK